MIAELQGSDNSLHDSPRSREEKILSKLLELIQQDIDQGCKHCSWILAKVFEKEIENK